jgi:hypothetical protein
MERRLLACACATLLATTSLAANAFADDLGDRLSLGGYLRIQGLTDFQGGNGRLGLPSNGCGTGGPCLYGRLLNEGPDAIFMLRLQLLPIDKSGHEPWAVMYARIEGESFLGTDAGNGGLSNYAITSFGIEAGNVLLDHVTWRVGTLWYEPNTMGLYDYFVDDLFYGVIGLSGFYHSKSLDLMIGAGDQGWQLHGSNYDTVITSGGWVRGRLGEHLELGGGGQFGYEAASQGNENGPYQTPGVSYIDFYRQDIVQQYFAQLGAAGNVDTLLPNPDPRSSVNWKLVGYLGIEKLGPLKSNNLYFHYLRNPPQQFVTEQFTPPGGTAPQSYTIYVHDLTDQQYELIIGDEAQVSLVPKRLDLAVGAIYGQERNNANTQVAGLDNENFESLVARFQLYMTNKVHFLFETSVAHEQSLNGNLFRDHEDSIFANDNGIPDTLGLQYGDSNVRNTWQGKTGIVLNPNGMGIFTRPSLRLLYGLQYSTAQDAFQSGFVTSASQFNQFVGPEQHWHSVVGVEAEAWF